VTSEWAVNAEKLCVFKPKSALFYAEILVPRRCAAALCLLVCVCATAAAIKRITKKDNKKHKLLFVKHKLYLFVICLVKATVIWTKMRLKKRVVKVALFLVIRQTLKKVHKSQSI